MVVQFQCPACAQPLEIDDEWASKSVACPYCQRTVTAPASSTLEEEPVPTATPMTPPTPTPSADHATPWMQAPTAPARNPLAGWSLALASAAVVVFIGTNFILAGNPEFRELAEKANEAAEQGKSQRELQELFLDQLGSGDLPGWVVTATIGALCTFSLWVAGLVCGLTALSRPGPRRKAHLGLFFCAGLVGMFCLGFLFG